MKRKRRPAIFYGRLYSACHDAVPVWIILFVLINVTSCAQPVPVKNRKEPTASLLTVAHLPPRLREASGVLALDNLFWIHNDDGLPVIYAIDSTGTVVKTVYINGTNNGWEDINSDRSGRLFVANIGNNGNNRKDLRIYIVPIKALSSTRPVAPEIVRFHYEDQKEFPPKPAEMNFDADAFLYWKNHFYIFTKNRTDPFTGYSKVYRIPAYGGNHTAVLIDSIKTGSGTAMHNWVTGAAISPDERSCVLLLHNRILLIRDFRADCISCGNIERISLRHYSHKTGVSFLNNDQICIVDELEFGLIGGKLYRMSLPGKLDKISQNAVRQ